MDSNAPPAISKAVDEICANQAGIKKTIAELSSRQQRSVLLSLLHDKNKQFLPFQLARATQDYSNDDIINSLNSMLQGVPHLITAEKIEEKRKIKFTPLLTAKGIYPDLMEDDKDEANIRKYLKAVVGLLDEKNLEAATKVIDSLAPANLLQSSFRDPQKLCDMVRVLSDSMVELDLLHPPVYKIPELKARNDNTTVQKSEDKDKVPTTPEQQVNASMHWATLGNPIPSDDES